MQQNARLSETNTEPGSVSLFAITWSIALFAGKCNYFFSWFLASQGSVENMEIVHQALQRQQRTDHNYRNHHQERNKHRIPLAPNVTSAKCGKRRISPARQWNQQDKIRKRILSLCLPESMENEAADKNCHQQELHLTSGAFLDIGGASTEIVTFEDSAPVDFASFPIGSLSLYRRCVKKILPGDGSLKRLQQEITQAIDVHEDALAPRPLVVGVGGTARAALKLARHYYKISDDCRSMTAGQLDGLCKFLCSGKKEASDLILRLEPERIHTLVPGILILRHVFHLFQAEQLIVSKYGVREGYLCQKILKNNIDTPKTEN